MFFLLEKWESFGNNKFSLYPGRLANETEVLNRWFTRKRCYLTSFREKDTQPIKRVLNCFEMNAWIVLKPLAKLVNLKNFPAGRSYVSAEILKVAYILPIERYWLLVPI